MRNCRGTGVPCPDGATGIKITYDPKLDVLRILFSNAPIEESEQDKPGYIIDYDRDSNVVGMEILEASKRMDNPYEIRYAVID